MYKCLSTGEEAETYTDYLKTEHWKNTRSNLLATHHYSCCVCNKKSYLQVHHATYDNVGNEKDTDLLIVCKKHHYEFHKGIIKESDYSNKKLKNKRAKRKRKPTELQLKVRERKRLKMLEEKEVYDAKFKEM